MSERLYPSMNLCYRKGAIVPRLIAKSKHRKLQHRIKFGCDVVVCGKRVEAITEGNIVEVGARPRKGNRLLQVIFDQDIFVGPMQTVKK